MKNDLFKGIKVVELASVLAGPAVGMWFAEMGAKVVKIENKRTAGDITRTWKTAAENPHIPISAYFSSVNGGKEYLFLNLADKNDFSRLEKELESCDILIVNFKQGDAEKFSLSYRQLKPKYPHLIYLAIKGFREQPERPAYDVVLQAETGWMSINGYPNQEPLKVPVAIIDLFAAHQAKQGALCALYHRLKTKQGSQIEVYLEDAAISALANQASNYLMTGRVPERSGSLHPNIAPYGEHFYFADNTCLVLAIGTDAQFDKFCQIVHTPELIHDERFCTNAFRVQHRHQLYEIWAPIFKKLNGESVYRESLAAKVPIAKIKDIGEVLESAYHQHLIWQTEEDGHPTSRLRTSVFDWNFS